jgi:hypothetical protein
VRSGIVARYFADIGAYAPSGIIEQQGQLGAAVDAELKAGGGSQQCGNA